MTLVKTSPKHIMGHQADPEARIKCSECEMTSTGQYQSDNNFSNCHITREKVKGNSKLHAINHSEWQSKCDQCDSDKAYHT